MARKRKQTYPTRAKGPRPEGGRVVPQTHVDIDTSAALGRAGVGPGSRARILGSGLYAGQVVTVERLVGGVIPAALVRTASGQSRQVRTIDLEPVRGVAAEPAAD